MKINWKLRLQNRYTVTALVTCVITFIYNILDAFGIVPPIEETAVTSVAETLIAVLLGLGILVDPTTKGVSDSELAMSRDKIN